MNESIDDVLAIHDLRVSFETDGGCISALRGVNLRLRRGKTLALVGESGSGKSVTAYSILRLIQPPGRIVGGAVVFRPKIGAAVDIAALPMRSEALYRIRGGKISMIFQEPMTALSPVHTIGNQLIEAIRLHKFLNKKSAKQLAAEMLTRVGIADADRRLRQYPFEFSGGMRQRVVIAMALVTEPEILIADEPTTALDVTVQAQILRLIDDLRRETGTSVLFITHDLGVVAQVADDVAVMWAGRILERANTRQFFKSPLHPYSRELLAAAQHDVRDRRAFDPFAAPAGWEFHPAGNALDDPKIHTMEDGRELLLWPSLTGV